MKNTDFPYIHNSPIDLSGREGAPRINICPTCDAPASLCYDKFPRRVHIPRCANNDGKAQYSDALCWTCYQRRLAQENRRKEGLTL